MLNSFFAKHQDHIRTSIVILLISYSFMIKKSPCKGLFHFRYAAYLDSNTSSCQIASRGERNHAH